MSESRIKCVSVWEVVVRTVASKGKVNVKFELEDDRTKTVLLPRSEMSNLADKLYRQLDPKTESFRPFLGGTAGWVWEKTFKEAAHVEAF